MLKTIKLTEKKIRSTTVKNRVGTIKEYISESKFIVFKILGFSIKIKCLDSLLK